MQLERLLADLQDSNIRQYKRLEMDQLKLLFGSKIHLDMHHNQTKFHHLMRFCMYQLGME
jgi:hypothetical protein